MNDQEITKSVEEAMERVRKSGRRPILAGVLRELPLDPVVEEHFKSPENPYLWNRYPIQPEASKEHAGLFMGVCMNESTPHILVVVATMDVINYTLNLKHLTTG